jgi:hypothetical protein
MLYLEKDHLMILIMVEPSGFQAQQVVYLTSFLAVSLNHDTKRALLIYNDCFSKGGVS